MPVPGEAGPRTRGLPRQQQPPEHNIIQNPGLTRGIQRVVGARQSHISPALAEGLQPTLSVGSLAVDPRTGIPASYASLMEIVPNGVDVKRATFVNKLSSGVVAVLRRLHIYQAADYLTAVSDVVYNTIYTSGIVWNLTALAGTRLVSGFNPDVGGVPQPQPPTQGTDIIFPPPRSQCGFHNPPLTGIDGGYIWRGVMNGPAGDNEILENFNTDAGPRMIVFPGGVWQTYIIDANAHWYCNLWWDEYPLT